MESRSECRTPRSRPQQESGATAFYCFLRYDPVPVLRQVKSPVLAINGSKDLQVSARRTWRRSAPRSPPMATPKQSNCPGCNHLFQTAKTGAASEYGEIEETIAPSVLELISQWVGARARVDAAP